MSFCTTFWISSWRSSRWRSCKNSRRTICRSYWSSSFGAPKASGTRKGASRKCYFDFKSFAEAPRELPGTFGTFIGTTENVPLISKVLQRLQAPRELPGASGTLKRASRKCDFDFQNFAEALMDMTDGKLVGTKIQLIYERATRARPRCVTSAPT